jgi:AbrB family looped-hinge helix DNA binding protein
MAIRIKVNNKNQIILPASIRKHLRIKSGDHVFIEVRGNTVILTPEPRNHSKRLRGLHREMWDDIDPVEYVRRERDAWDDFL